MNLDTLPSDQHLQSRWVAIDAASQKRPGFRLRRTSVTSLLVVGLVGGSSFAAYAAHEANVAESTAAEEMVVINQQAALLGPLNDELDAWFQKFYNVAVGPGKADSDKGWPSRYGGTAINMETRVQTVWWRGAPPDDVVDFLAQPTTEFTVQLKSISVSKRDLDHAALKIIWADQKKHPLVKGMYVSSFTRTADRTGLIINYGLEDETLPEHGEEDLLAAARSLVDIRIVKARRVEVFSGALLTRVPGFDLRMGSGPSEGIKAGTPPLKKD
jgi:hypothetical protein